MMDIKLIRENPSFVRKNLEKRRNPEKLALLEEVIAEDKLWRENLQKLEKMKQKKNEMSVKLATERDEKKIGEMKELSKNIEKLESNAKELYESVKKKLMRLPNLLHESVPFGKDDSENVEIKRTGTLPKFSFKLKNHLDIALDLKLIDQERAAKVAGHGFFYFRDKLVLLDYALINFAVGFLVKKGFIVIEPPLMIKRKPYEGVTEIEAFENVMYKVDKEDLYMIATSEHPMAAMFMDEVLNEQDMPIKLCGVSPCFRKEVGAHGKYTRGMFRMHQFNKIEQFVFCHPDDSWKIHEELQENAEALYKKLGLPIRVLNVCTGDIGDIAAKKYDTDVWMADGEFREIGSNSNCTDYQARRLNIRYREKPGAKPAGFVHTLNNTAIATSRTIMALLEVHQQKDGNVKIPAALQKFLPFKKLEPLDVKW